MTITKGIAYWTPVVGIVVLSAYACMKAATSTAPPVPVVRHRFEAVWEDVIDHDGGGRIYVLTLRDTVDGRCHAVVGTSYGAVPLGVVPCEAPR